MSRRNAFRAALQPTPAEIEAKQQIKRAHDDAMARIEQGYTIGQGMSTTRLRVEAEEQGLCLSFNRRFIRALGAALTGATEDKS